MITSARARDRLYAVIKEQITIVPWEHNEDGSKSFVML